MKCNFKNMLAALLVLVMVLSMVPMTAIAAPIQNVEWTGAMNYGDDNNAVYTLGSLTPTEMTYTKEAWKVQVNTSSGTWGVYAGQTAIADDMLYITGTNGLLKINTATGAIADTLAGVGTTNFAYDYLVIDKATNLLFVIQSAKIEVVSLDTFTEVGEYTNSALDVGSLGQYHPAQIHNGYLICNGYSFKINGAPQGEEPYLTAINAKPFGTDTENAALTKNFYWSSGAFINELFYVTCLDAKSASPTYKHCLVLAVDYKTGEVKHTFDAGDATAYASDSTVNKSINAYNTTGQIAYDSETGYLYWSNRFCKYLFAVKVNADGTFANEMLTALLSRNTGTVCAPVIANGRVYIAGQGEGWGQGGDICVVNADPASDGFMTEIYATNAGIYKVQSNPVLFQDGNTNYIVVQSYVAPGYLFILKDTADSTTGTLEMMAIPSEGAVVALDSGTSSGGAYAFEQIATDNEGRIYAYNESGYLFCFEKSEIAIPKITKNLSTDRVKYALNAAAEALSVEATLNGYAGTLSYQWQVSADKADWADITGATEASYTPSTVEEKTAYYRVAVTNTVGEKKETVYSDTAWILSKVYSNDTSLSGLKINQANSYTSSSVLQTVELTAGTHYYGAYAATRNWVNVWPDATFEEAIIKVYAVENVAEGKFDAETKEIAITAANSGHNRYAIYAADETKPWAVRIVVTAENGNTADYVLVLSYAEAEADAKTLLSKIQSDDVVANQAAAKTASDKINAIGTVTLNSKDAIEAARAAYDALTDAQKALVTNLEALTRAEVDYAELVNLVGPSITGDGTPIALLITVMVACVAIIAVMIFRKKEIL